MNNTDGTTEAQRHGVGRVKFLPASGYGTWVPRAAMFLVSLGIAAFFIVRRETKTWSLEVENRTPRTIAVIGITKEREGIDFELVRSGERMKATIATDGIRPYGVHVQFAAQLDDDGFPLRNVFERWCEYEDAADAKPLVVTEFELDGCDELPFDD